jgi:arylsulfatase A-like enzyme
MVLALDKDIDSFFTYLDKTIGLANVIVAFTADHGIAPIPTESAKLGVASARLDLEAFSANLNAALNQKFSPGGKKNYLMPTQELPYIALDPRAFGNVSEKDAEQAAVDAVPAAVRALGSPAPPPNNLATPEATRKYEEARLDADPAVAFVRSRSDLAAGDKVPPTEFGRLINHSYTTHGGWYVMVVPTAYQMEYLSGIQTTHFSPWSYDRHVPLGFYGAAFAPGYYRDQVAPVDIAATFASLLGVNFPSAAVGHVLTMALKPSH